MPRNLADRLAAALLVLTAALPAAADEPAEPVPETLIDEATGETVNQPAGALPLAGEEEPPTVPLEAFYGAWAGTGVAEEDAGTAFFAVMARDLDVQIVPEGESLRISWQTLIRAGDDTRNPDQRLRAASLVLDPTDRAHVFRARSNGDLLAGGTVGWARLHGDTLSVYQMTLNAAGGHELLIYDRGFEDPEDPEVMTLVFRRLTDGRQVRVVRGRLSRTGSGE